MNQSTWDQLRALGVQRRALPETPADLHPYACYIPDAGYCIMAIPEKFAAEAKRDPEMYLVPIPARYVIEQGYRIDNGIVYAGVEYDPFMGVIVPESAYVYDAEDKSKTIEMQILKVGETYAPFVGAQECVKFDITDAGAIVCACFNRPTPHEIAQYAANKAFKAGFFYRDGVLFLLFKFGDLNWVDAPYTPHLSRGDMQKYIDGQALPLTCLLIDVPDGIIAQRPRLIGLDTQFTAALMTVVAEMRAQHFDANAYYGSVAAAMQKYSTNEMVAQMQYGFEIPGGKC